MYRIGKSKERNIYISVIGGVMLCSLFIIFVYATVLIENEIPSDIKIMLNQEGRFSAAFPITASFNEDCVGTISVDNKLLNKNNLNVNIDKDFSIKGNKIGKYKADVKAFGVITLKKINLEVIENKKLIVGGMPVGIYVETDGLLVLGTGEICSLNGVDYSPAKNILKPGDYILAINDTKVSDKQKFIKYIQMSNSEDLKLTLRRNEQIINVAVKKIKCKDGKYKIGTWIRNNMQGIGTLTYVDRENNSYGALGHGINDIDTNELMEIKNGSIYNASIIDIVKGRVNKPGELVGVINHSNDYRLGNLKYNTKCGIFGDVDKKDINSIITSLCNDSLKDEYEIALKQDVKIGNAKIRTEVDDTIRDYDIVIEKINRHNLRGNKNFIIRVVDAELLNLTGGIVQGMSGSPIIQNNKVIGALTHVFVNNPTRGYGIFIDNMLESK